MTIDSLLSSLAETMSSRKPSGSFLKKETALSVINYIVCGIDSHQRALLWLTCSGVNLLNSEEYRELIAAAEQDDSGVNGLITDVTRSLSRSKEPHNPDTRNQVVRLCSALQYFRGSDSGFGQHIVSLASFLVEHIGTELGAWACLQRLVQVETSSYWNRSHSEQSSGVLVANQLLLETLLLFKDELGGDAGLTCLIVNWDSKFRLLYFEPWTLTLFTHGVSREACILLWDYFMVRGFGSIVFAQAALVLLKSPLAMSSSTNSMELFIDISGKDWINMTEYVRSRVLGTSTEFFDFVMEHCRPGHSLLNHMLLQRKRDMDISQLVDSIL